MRPAGAVGWLLTLASASGAAEQTTFTVMYRSESRVYLDAGSTQGLSEGDRLKVTEGSAVQAVVPAGAWQSARPLGGWALVGCIVAPAFDFAGFELAPPDWRPGA